jgi:hypothetical protein
MGFQLVPMSIRTLKSDPETFDTFWKILLRSTAYAITAYFISYILEKILLVGGAVMKGFTIDLKYNYTKVIADFRSWDQETVLLIYLIPFFIQALIIIALYLRFLNKATKSDFGKIFLLWLMFFIVYRLLGIFPGHLIFKTGIYHALNWLNFGPALNIIAGITSAGIFLYAGFQILRGILALSGTYHYHIRDMGIPNLIFSTLLIPLGTVNLVAVLFFLPGLPKDEALGLVIIFLLAIYVFFKSFTIDPNLFSFKEKVSEKSNPGWLVTIALIAVIFLRIMLDVEISAS